MADDGIKLTDDEVKVIAAASSGYSPRKKPGDWEYSFPHDALLAAVESIVAARVQALTAERDELRKQYRLDHAERDLNRRERDAARAELAAANTRIAELEEAGTQSFVLGELVPDPLLTEHEAQVTDALRSRLAKSEATNAALSARLERVRALAEQWDGEGIHSDDPLMALCDHEARAVIAQLPAALGEDA